MYNQIQQLSEPDQLYDSVMRREVNFKKIMFFNILYDFPLFRQYNITAKVMYQNLIQLHWVDDSNQKTVSVEDIYEITDIASLGKNKAKKRNSPSEAQPEVDLTWSLF